MTGRASKWLRARGFRAVAAVALILAVAGATAGCGRKARPEPRFGCAGSPTQTT